MIVDHFDRQGVARFYAGEPIGVELQLLDAEGAVQDLTSRAFAMTLFGADRVAVNSIAGVATSDGAVAFHLAGSISAGLFGRTDLRWEIAELVVDGRDVLDGGQLLILAAPGSVTPTAGVSTGATVTRFVRQIETDRPRLILSQRGAAGASAAAVLFAAGLIDGPTADALGNYLRAPAIDAAAAVNALLPAIVDQLATLRPPRADFTMATNSSLIAVLFQEL